MKTGRVFEIREFALHDGPGVRTTVFLKGCPLRCAWCHNPEGQSFEVETIVRKDGTRLKCGKDWTAEALAEELLSNADIMRQSGGGVTFSGGEPLSQADFLLDVAALLKNKGVHVALETSGAVEHSIYRAVISVMDFVYQDLKHFNAAKFKEWTGGSLGEVLENIDFLRESKVPHVLRVPVIPGVNDSPSDRAAFMEIAGASPIEFLPYNHAAAAKYPLLGRDYPLASKCRVFFGKI